MTDQVDRRLCRGCWMDVFPSDVRLAPDEGLTQTDKQRVSFFYQTLDHNKQRFPLRLSTCFKLVGF